jgi:hypothetical protein
MKEDALLAILETCDRYNGTAKLLRLHECMKTESGDGIQEFLILEMKRTIEKDRPLSSPYFMKQAVNMNSQNTQVLSDHDFTNILEEIEMKKKDRERYLLKELEIVAQHKIQESLRVSIYGPHR